MAQLYFNYGVMGSSKTANALMTYFNYKTIGKKVILVKSEVDTRDDGVIKSRIGLSENCISINQLMNLRDYEIKQYEAIIVDEAQFLVVNEVDWLSDIVDNYNIPVICYGLRTDSKGKLFTGSKRLLEVADSIREIKTVCWCGRKATFNARFDANGKVIKSGKQIQMGANESYIGLCRKHWKLGDIGEAKRLEVGIDE